MKQKFADFNFKKGTLKIIQQANEIIEDYQEQGYDLTLRQLYYQFVARDLIPNSQKSYSRLGDIINNARLNGDIDWSAIKDRTRRLSGNPHDESPSSAIDYAAWSYAIDKREGQPIHLEVWVEKEALAGVVGRAASDLDIDFFSCRGYVSQTAMYEASRRFYKENAEECVILHLGDHDPSGIDMTRDITERLNGTFGVPTTIKRIALNKDQIDLYNPPPNPAKLTDSRVGGYIQKYGSLSWELDALEPRVITELITKHAEEYTDMDLYNRRKELEQRQKNEIEKFAQNYDSLVAYLQETGEL